MLRRPSTVLVVLLGLSLTVPTALAAPAGAVEEPRLPEPAVAAVLQHASDALAGDVAAPDGTVESPTLALRDLFLALPRLTGTERRDAEGLLARPTAGANDPNGDGYTTRSRRTCSDKICVHWVPRTADAPPGRGWVDKTLSVMKTTWAHEIGRLGYRRPVTDGQRGGNQKFDVYLKDVGSQGFYGYCAPERRQEGWRWRASGYCVLDDDFAREQFGVKPIKSLKVTAAHEFFHAVQFGYDYGEDRWLMEGSATWMEERVADGVNDNRQYLKYGQVSRPAAPLDTYAGQGFVQYGNWAFFEYLSQRWGNRVVRDIWSIAADRKDDPRDPYSTLAVQKALPGRATFPGVFGSYAAANTVPSRTYPEGDRWSSAPSARTHTLTSAAPSVEARVRIDHLASKNLTVLPGDGVAGTAWRLRVRIDGPVRATDPTVVLLVHRTDGGLTEKVVPLDQDGDGTARVRIGSKTVSKVTVTLANASTRFACWKGDYTYSCQGTPRDDDKRFDYTLSASKS